MDLDQETDSYLAIGFNLAAADLTAAGWNHIHHFSWLPELRPANTTGWTFAR